MSTHRTVALPILSALLAACTVADPGAPRHDEPGIGTTKEAVSSGTVDTANAYPFVGQLSTPAGLCSAELVSPTMLLTANHCVTGDTANPYPQGVSGNYTVTFDPLGFNAASPVKFQHLSDPSQALTWARVRQTTPVAWNDLNQVDQDIALIELDSAVPSWIATPVGIGGFNGTSCNIAESDNALMIGYGSTDVSLCSSNVLCPGAQSGRNWVKQPGWSIEDQSNGDKVFQNDWFYATGYTGLVPGDSGGALLRLPTVSYSGPPLVCGINSSFEIVADLEANNWDPVMDSPGNHAFLQKYLYNSDGTLRGTCSVSSAGVIGNSAPTGGESITIHGSGFDTTPGRMGVSFGPNPGTITCASDTSCVIVTPAGVSSQPITISRRGATCSAPNHPSVLYSPSVTGVIPAAGTVGDTVTIIGNGFNTGSGTTTFTFGGVPATNVVCATSASCYATVPAGARSVDVVAVIGTTASLGNPLDEFTYTGPVITSLGATRGPVSGGTRVDLYGSGFDPNAAADGSMQFMFGGPPLSGVTCMSSTWCTVYSPTGVPSIVRPEVSVFGYWSSGGPTFQYDASPLLTGVWVAGDGTGAVNLDGNALSAGTPVALTSTAPNVVVPSSVTVGANTTGKTFSWTLLPSPTAGTATITATLAGSTVTTTYSYGASPPVALIAPASMYVSENSSEGDALSPGETETLTIAFATPAPAAGYVTLTSSAPTIVSVPAQIAISQYQQLRTFPIATAYAGAAKDVTITATFDGSSGSTSFWVPQLPPPVNHCGVVIPKCATGYEWDTVTCKCVKGIIQ